MIWIISLWPILRATSKKKDLLMQVFFCQQGALVIFDSVLPTLWLFELVG